MICPRLRSAGSGRPCASATLSDPAAVGWMNSPARLRDVPIRLRPWSAASTDSRTSTASRARCAGSAGSSPDEVARYLFRRVVSWGRSSNVFLQNGARLYLDVGSHPEYATPECDSLYDLVVHDKAGERILEIARRVRRAATRRGIDPRHHLPVQEQHRLGGQLATAVTRTTSPAGATISATTPRC